MSEFKMGWHSLSFTVLPALRKSRSQQTLYVLNLSSLPDPLDIGSIVDFEVQRLGHRLMWPVFASQTQGIERAKTKA